MHAKLPMMATNLSKLEAPPQANRLVRTTRTTLNEFLLHLTRLSPFPDLTKIPFSKILMAGNSLEANITQNSNLGNLEGSFIASWIGINSPTPSYVKIAVPMNTDQSELNILIEGEIPCWAISNEQ
ncbi:hypothetical protein WICPIJ_004358 [Wickerhamomyces pijperi]|uniref:Uncharacterized protein n=1 Tax=Wickerhamomyces pijperi TaxID=599730 RepID=A0A9P8Q608_WICPI|nr:hypothetical protein WICPIJ_004358 [Wickerhamomyces pijperi]